MAEGFTCVKCGGKFYEDQTKFAAFHFDFGIVHTGCCPFCGVSKCGKYTDPVTNKMYLDRTSPWREKGGLNEAEPERY